MNPNLDFVRYVNKLFKKLDYYSCPNLLFVWDVPEEYKKSLPKKASVI